MTVSDLNYRFKEGLAKAAALCSGAVGYLFAPLKRVTAKKGGK